MIDYRLLVKFLFGRGALHLDRERRKRSLSGNGSIVSLALPAVFDIWSGYLSTLM